MSLAKSFVCLLVFLSVSASPRSNTSAQVRPIYDQGALGLTQLLRKLNTNARALMIGAHPDDEDTALLAYLARGENARTAYLSLTRGDGGQNIIGPELGEALGVIRTEELLQARKLDGAEQYFARAYDYGFSKTLAEAKQKWDESLVLCDVVRVIRDFRPQVVISQFNGTASDGHGQHQFAGYISPIAVKAAGDVSQCRTAGPVWTVSKVYVRHRGQGEPTLRINTGKYDPVLGRSYFEIAMHARSQHRSQEQGVLELRGDQFSNLTLLTAGDASRAKESGIFSGLDLSKEQPNTCFSEAIASALKSYNPAAPDAVLPQLIRAHGCLDTGGRTTDTSRVDDLRRAIELAAGLQIDALSDSETAAQDEEVQVRVNVYSPIGNQLRVRGVTLGMPPGWTHSEFVSPPESATAQTGNVRRETPVFSRITRIQTPKNDMELQPYWLEHPRRGDLYDWSAASGEGEASQTLPLRPPIVRASVEVEIQGKPITFRRGVEYRFADDIRGEVRRPFTTTPKVTLTLSNELIIIPRGADDSTEREISVVVTNNSKRTTSGAVTLAVPDGWTVRADNPGFVLRGKSEKANVKFLVTIPQNVSPGSYEMLAEATVDGEKFARSMQTITYEHIQTHRIYRPAKVTAKLIDVQRSSVKVGYIRGSGDRVMEAIRQMGFSVEEIDERTLASGDLSVYNTIVVGIRAYQVRPDLVANNQRLMDFAKLGGTLIVQYQLPNTYSQQALAPYPVQMGPRVADENAPVTFLNPGHPVFNFPNKITQDDFTGWVQERNLYNFSTMDPKYVGLLESHDAGEPENRGGLVVADVGKGKYVYCSYSLFRQLPAGVPGAYRLLANLLSLGTAPAVK